MVANKVSRRKKSRSVARGIDHPSPDTCAHLVNGRFFGQDKHKDGVDDSESNLSCSKTSLAVDVRMEISG